MMIVKKFDSLTHCFLEAKKGVDRKNGSSYNDDEDEADWYGNYPFDDYISDYENMKTEVSRQLQSEIKKAKDKMGLLIENNRQHLIPSNIFNETHNVNGSYVDVGSYLEMNPECMIDFESPKKQRNCNIFFRMTATSGESEQIKNTGIILYVLTLLLKGIKKNIFGVISNGNDREDCVYMLVPIVKISDITIPVRIEHVLINLMAFYRRAGFAIYEGLPTEVRNHFGYYSSGNYSRSFDISEEHIEKIFGIKCDLYVGRDIIGTNLEPGCERLITALINQQRK